MHATFAFLGRDLVDREPGLIGVGTLGYTALTPYRFPAVLHNLHLVAQVILTAVERGQRHHLRIEVIDADGHVQGTLAEFTFEPDPTMRGPRVRLLHATCAHFAFPTPGDYSFRLWGDAEQLADVPLSLGARGAPATA